MTDEKEASVQDVADELGSDAGMLVAQMLLASAKSASHTIEQLHSVELRRRLILESQIMFTLNELSDAYMGSAREYENAVRSLRKPWVKSEREWLEMHPDYDTWKDYI